jgi:hypothetical protein
MLPPTIVRTAGDQACSVAIFKGSVDGALIIPHERVPLTGSSVQGKCRRYVDQSLCARRQHTLRGYPIDVVSGGEGRHSPSLLPNYVPEVTHA